MSDYKNVMNKIKIKKHGVFVQSSSLGSLEALLSFLQTSNIPVAGVNIGPIHLSDVKKASIMLQKKPVYAAILAFDVKINTESLEFAEKEGIKIFRADIIYHLFDQFTE